MNKENRIIRVIEKDNLRRVDSITGPEGRSGGYTKITVGDPFDSDTRKHISIDENEELTIEEING